MDRKKVALFNYKVTPTSPSGGCNLQMLEQLCEKYDFTVFAVDFENPRPDRIEFVEVPVATRPLALLFVLFYAAAWMRYRIYCWRQDVQFDLVHTQENYVGFGDVSEMKFCHRHYLEEHWEDSSLSGLRGGARWMDHQMRAASEGANLRRVRRIVSPSRGLARELQHEYPFTEDKTTVIPNPIDIDYMSPPDGFERREFRREHGFSSEDVVHVFVALGHFERKGLPLLLEALAHLGERQKLLVVGGEENLIHAYRRKANQHGLNERVRFVGMQRDVRPFLWASDACAFPSFYEVFPLGVLEAAAAGLPLISTPLNGVEQYLEDGRNGLLVERSVEGVHRGLRRFASLPAERRAEMGRQAQESVRKYAPDRYASAWDDLYTRVISES